MRAEAEQCREDRVERHGKRARRRDRDQHQGELRLIDAFLTERARQGEGRGRAANRDRSTGENAEC